MALVKLLQHLLTLTVRERVTEREVGGGSSHLRKPVSEREDELVVYDLESDLKKWEKSENVKNNSYDWPH